MSAPKKTKSNSGPNRLVLIGLVCSAIFAAAWGILTVLAGYSQTEFLDSLSHVPFWLSIGAVGFLLNYLPIAKSKPKPFPIIGPVSYTHLTLPTICSV